MSSSRSVYGEGKYRCPDHGFIYPSERSLIDLENRNYNFSCEHCKQKLICVATDENSNINPSSVYAITKYTQEQLLRLAGKNLNILKYKVRFSCFL